MYLAAVIFMQFNWSGPLFNPSGEISLPFAFHFIYFIFEINVYLVTNNSIKINQKDLVFNTDFI